MRLNPAIVAGTATVDPTRQGTKAGLRYRWSVDPGDYTKPPAPAILARVLAKVGPGAIVLLHDGGGDRSHTVAILKQLIDALKAKGFSFVIA